MQRTQTSSAGNSLIDFNQNMDNKVRLTMGDIDASYDMDSLNLVTASFGVRGMSNDNNGTGYNRMNGGYYGTGFGYTALTNTNMPELGRYRTAAGETGFGG